MDDLGTLIAVAGIGWLIGIAGFVIGVVALREARALRRMLDLAPAPERLVPVQKPRSVPETALPVSAPDLVTPAVEDVVTASLVPPPARPHRDLETLLTLRWGVWLGSAALLMAGVFLVRYAADAGLLGPPVRCLLAALLGVALLAAAEWSARRPARPVEGFADQVPAALAAGGVGVLFGAAYAAGPFYGLLPLPIGFGLLALAALAGLVSSLRYGQLVAAVGIVGGYATPLLVPSDAPSLPGLFGYLVVLVAVALLVVRARAWVWLGWATSIAASGWVLLAASIGGAGLWAAGVFVPVAAALSVFLLPDAALEQKIGRVLAWVPFAALGLAGLILEASQAGDAARWGVLALSPVAVACGAGERRLDRLPWIAAGFGVLALIAWALPAWTPTGEVIATDDIVEAILPGAWAPQIIHPLLWTAALLASLHAAAGLWLERRSAHSLHWAALVAAVPPVVLATVYLQVALFRPDVEWATAALLLAAALTATATRAARDASAPRAGVHAAGASASLALGLAMLLRDQWLTLALSLLLPALAWIAGRAGLPALRRVAAVVAAIVLARLVLNPEIARYTFGTAPVLNGLLAAYGVPAAAFAAAALLFRRQRDGIVVAILEGGAILLTALLVGLEIRHAATSGHVRANGSFGEGAAQVSALALEATMTLWLGRRTGRGLPRIAGESLGGLALLGGIALVLINPLLADQPAGALDLAFSYLVPAAFATAAIRYATPAQRPVLGVYAGVAGFVWIALQIRSLFHPDALGADQSDVTQGELWSLSGGWLAYGAALMAAGIVLGLRVLRLTALGIIALVALKVFLVDMANLEGLWRVLSFLGLGLALIGLGAVYRRFVVPTGEVMP